MAEASKASSLSANLLTVLRIVLGVIIVYKAIIFIMHTATLQSLTEQTSVGIFIENSKVLSFVIPYLGLLCGFFITVGLFTRASSIIQIPILIVAVFLVNIKSINNDALEFILSLIALILSILFAIKGSGVFSMDEYFRRGRAIDKRAEEQ